MTPDADRFWTDDDRDTIDVDAVIDDESFVLDDTDTDDELGDWGIDADDRAVEPAADDEIDVDRDEY